MLLSISACPGCHEVTDRCVQGSTSHSTKQAEHRKHPTVQHKANITHHTAALYSIQWCSTVGTDSKHHSRIWVLFPQRSRNALKSVRLCICLQLIAPPAGTSRHVLLSTLHTCTPATLRATQLGVLHQN